MTQTTQAGSRPINVLEDDHPNHHLSCSRGIWYVHHLVFPTTHTPVEIRRSLRTCDLGIARHRRDRLLRELSFAGGAE